MLAMTLTKAGPITLLTSDGPVTITINQKSKVNTMKIVFDAPNTVRISRKKENHDDSRTDASL